MSGLSDLPDHLLKVVLQHVPVKERLSSCCQVDTRMQAAAIAATTALHLEHYRDADDSVRVGGTPAYALQWLSKYAQHVTQLTLAGRIRLPALQQLPCHDLLDLRLEACVVYMGAADVGRVLGACTKLTRLILQDDLRQGALLGDSLSRLVNLRHFTVVPWAQQRAVAGLAPAVLPAWTQLTFLSVNTLSDHNLAQLGGLVSLRDLRLTAGESGRAFDFDAGEAPAVIGPSRVPGLAFPASLTRLSSSSVVEPGIFGLLPAGLRELDVTCDGGPIGSSSLLPGMARLQHLTALNLNSRAGLGLAWPPAGPAYSALTASSHLVFLQLDNTSLPAGVWPHVFPAGRQLPHLQHFQVRDVRGRFYETASWGPSDLASLVNCCPNLRVIEDISLKHGQHVSELCRLTALTRLGLDYCLEGMVMRPLSLQGLAAVTQLVHLRLCVYSSTPGVTAASLQPLTSLKSLKQLRCGARHWDPTRAGLSFETKAGSAPDVWLQLLNSSAVGPQG